MSKARIIDVFEKLTKNGVAFCKLCLRDEDERKLVSPNSVRAIMTAMNVEIFEDLTVCYVCEARAASAYRLLSMINFAIASNMLFKELRNGDTRRQVEELLKGDCGDLKMDYDLYTAAVDCEACLDSVTKETCLLQTEMLVIDSEQRVMPRNQNSTKTTCNVHTDMETVVIDDDDAEKDPLEGTDPLQMDSRNETQPSVAATTATNVLKERNVDRPTISVIPEAKLTNSGSNNPHTPMFQLVPTNNDQLLIFTDNLTTDNNRLIFNQSFNTPNQVLNNQNLNFLTQNKHLVIFNQDSVRPEVLSTNQNVNLAQNQHLVIINHDNVRPEVLSTNQNLNLTPNNHLVMLNQNNVCSEVLSTNQNVNLTQNKHLVMLNQNNVHPEVLSTNQNVNLTQNKRLVTLNQDSVRPEVLSTNQNLNLTQNKRLVTLNQDSVRPEVLSTNQNRNLTLNKRLGTRNQDHVHSVPLLTNQNLSITQNKHSVVLNQDRAVSVADKQVTVTKKVNICMDSIDLNIEQLLRAKVQELYKDNNYVPDKKKIRTDSDPDVVEVKDKGGEVVKAPVQKQGMIDFEDKIPMDVISFMDATDPHGPQLMSTLRRAATQPPRMGVISEVRSMNK